jgi:uncharacterized protein (TIGR02466 family)
MHNIKLFSTDIFQSNVDGINNQSLAEYCTYLKNNYPSNLISNKGGWQSKSLTNTDHPELKKLILNISEQLGAVYKSMSVNRKPKLSNFWINVNPPHAYNDRHNHTLSFFSVVYYVAVPEGSGEFIVERFDESKFFLQYFEHEVETAAQSYIIDPTESALIMFPSWVYHSVGANNSQKDRISIAFNFI